MCSFIFTNKEIVDLELVNFYTKFRGPDNTNIVKINQFNYVHNLLSITGQLSIQPFYKSNIVCFFNGEIYNYSEFGEYNTDGECLIDLYLKYGPEFTKKLDGEFAIVLVDHNKNKLVVSSDIFKTKPIFFSIEEKNIGISTYRTPLEKLGFSKIEKFKPNTTMVFNSNDFSIESTFELFTFDISNQHKNTLNDWTKAFENSISKRTKNLREKVFIGLSSGYDSGAICNELLKQKINFQSYSVLGSENEDIIKKRLDILKRDNIFYEILYKSDYKVNDSVEKIKRDTEPFYYTICSSTSNYNEFDRLLTDDSGSIYLSYVCEQATLNGCKILISGAGADEIISDYGFRGNKFYLHSNFGGLFPENLNDIFPWNSFYYSTMESYIAKEEYVGGSYGIEVRYPFLDKNLVQEFLWLSVELKNKSYKLPLEQYLEIHGFPFLKGQKLGF